MNPQIIFLLKLIVCVTFAMAGTSRLPPLLTEERWDFIGDPKEFFVPWGPMGYFNQFYNPSDVIGPEIMKGFAAPFRAHSGFNMMSAVPAPPLEIPVGPDSSDKKAIAKYKKYGEIQSRAGTILNGRESLFYVKNSF